PHPPIDSIPNEILSRIFESGYFEGENLDCDFRTLVENVSRRWWQTAHHTQSLWSTCHLSQGNLDNTIDDLPVFLKHSGDYPLDIYLVAAPTCGECNSALSRPVACLDCPFTGCWVDKHVQHHLERENHSFCLEVKSGCLFCFECNDFAYNEAVDDIYTSSILRAEEKTTRFQVSQMLRESYTPWVPNKQESSILEGTLAIPCQGRRGLLNLGQTCFMNVVLQCLVHNPLVRNYFLSDKHNRRQCKIDNCTCCEMDRLFEEVYSDDSVPYGPINFLTTTWKASAELSGHAQQDAHEFFISALNQIHSTTRGSTNVSCNCIIHSTFSGQLQSDVRCERCGNVTSTVDPMMDVSLEINKSNNGRSGPQSSTASKNGSGVEPLPGENTLTACLRRFTQPERLGLKDYSCGKCGKTHETSKRLSIRKLPPVLVFQLKRFEHKTADRSSARKIDTQIKFPATLNMASYTASSMKEAEKENANNNPKAFDGNGSGLDNSLYEYELFAVINHEGNLDNGHYINYARFKDEWFKFDDDKVTHSSLSACLQSSAYMLFYVKRHLNYKPNIVPSYIRMRETEAVREKERELEKEREREREKERERERARERERERVEREREVEDALLATV
ncbi:Ubiquitin carboxyl-terminal hydrolase 22, partial [Leucoagaricus sp. SymC.cos]